MRCDVCGSSDPSIRYTKVAWRRSRDGKVFCGPGCASKYRKRRGPIPRPTPEEVEAARRVEEGVLLDEEGRPGIMNSGLITTLLAARSCARAVLRLAKEGGGA